MASFNTPAPLPPSGSERSSLRSPPRRKIRVTLYEETQPLTMETLLPFSNPFVRRRLLRRFSSMRGAELCESSMVCQSPRRAVFFPFLPRPLAMEPPPPPQLLVYE